MPRFIVKHPDKQPLTHGRVQSFASTFKGSVVGEPMTGAFEVRIPATEIDGKFYEALQNERLDAVPANCLA